MMVLLPLGLIIIFVICLLPVISLTFVALILVPTYLITLHYFVLYVLISQLRVPPQPPHLPLQSALPGML